MHEQDSGKLCLTPEALATVRTFSTEEYAAFHDLYRSMCEADEVRSAAEARGVRITMMLFALYVMTFTMLFLIFVIGTPRIAHQAHVQVPPSLFSWDHTKHMLMNTSILMIVILLLSGFAWIVYQAGVRLGRFTRRGYIRAAYQEAATYLEAHREHLDRPLNLLRRMDEEMYRMHLEWIVWVGGPASALVAGRT